jgi:ATP-dependent DNA ligase
VRLVSRTGVDHFKRFRGVAEAIGEQSDETVVLDGEMPYLEPGTAITERPMSALLGRARSRQCQSG